MRLLALLLGLAAVILGVWIFWGEGYDDRFSLQGSVMALKDAGTYGWLVAWCLLVADVLLPVPGTVVMSALGWVYGLLWGGLLASTGSALAGMTAYGVCRVLGERGGQWLLGDKDLEHGKRWMDRGGGWLVCISRPLPLVSEVVACAAGLLGMPLRQFLPSLLCGSVPMGFVFAWIGATGKDAPQLAMVLSVGVPVALWACARWWFKRWENRGEG